MKKTPWIPVTPSDVTGKLGILHLPRMYELMTIAAQGRLPKGYNAKAKGGFHGMVSDGIGLDLEATATFVETERPTEVAFEDWVAKNATALTPENVEKLNAAILAYIHDDVTRQSILTLCGVADGDTAPKTAVALNKMEDAALAREARFKEPRRKFLQRKAGKTIVQSPDGGEQNSPSENSAETKAA